MRSAELPVQRADAAHASPRAVAVPVAAASDDVMVLLLAALPAASRLWGWARIVIGPRQLRGTPGLRFAKLLGSGHEGGFGLRPSASRQGLFAVFDSAAAAEAFLHRAPLVLAYRARATECCVLTLRAWSCRGRWAGHAMGVSALAPDGSPCATAGATARLGADSDLPHSAVASLTRASIRPLAARHFWRMAPAAEASLAAAPGCRLAVGLGEAPLLRQATFTLWDSVSAMDAYARSGAHLQAIRAAHSGGHFSESMFVRFVPLAIEGTWMGVRHG